MEPGAEIKFCLHLYRVEFKFRPRLGACKDKISRSHALFCQRHGLQKPARLIIYVAQALSRIGAILNKIKQR